MWWHSLLIAIAARGFIAELNPTLLREEKTWR